MCSDRKRRLGRSDPSLRTIQCLSAAPCGETHQAPSSSDQFLVEQPPYQTFHFHSWNLKCGDEYISDAGCKILLTNGDSASPTNCRLRCSKIDFLEGPNLWTNLLYLKISKEAPLARWNCGTETLKHLVKLKYCSWFKRKGSARPKPFYRTKRCKKMPAGQFLLCIWCKYASGEIFISFLQNL